MVDKRERKILKGMQNKEKEGKAEVLGVNNVSKTCTFRSPSHFKKAVVPHSSDPNCSSLPWLSQPWVRCFSFKLLSLTRPTVHPLLSPQSCPSPFDSSWPRQGERPSQGHPAFYIRPDSPSFRHLCAVWRSKLVQSVDLSPQLYLQSVSSDMLHGI